MSTENVSLRKNGSVQTQPPRIQGVFSWEDIENELFKEEQKRDQNLSLNIIWERFIKSLTGNTSIKKMRFSMFQWDSRIANVSAFVTSRTFGLLFQS